tara:strand:- start:980 stop:1237 length:258 start_codon:yes stop_codon:yes gene_type:complete
MKRLYKGYTIEKMFNTSSLELIFCAYNRNGKLVNCTSPRLRTVKCMLDYKIDNNKIQETGLEFMLETLEEKKQRELNNIAKRYNK